MKKEIYKHEGNRKKKMKKDVVKTQSREVHTWLNTFITLTPFLYIL